MHCVVNLHAFCLCINQAICFDFGYSHTNPNLSIMAYLKAIKCVKVNLQLLQHDYGEGDTNLDRGVFARK